MVLDEEKSAGARGQRRRGSWGWCRGGRSFSPARRRQLGVLVGRKRRQALHPDGRGVLLPGHLAGAERLLVLGLAAGPERVAELHGYPLKITEIAAQLEGTCYVTRQSVETVSAIRSAKKAIRKAFENSMNKRGSSLVEIVSTCSSGWKLTPQKANKWMEENMFKFYPKGDLKDTTK